MTMTTNSHYARPPAPPTPAEAPAKAPVKAAAKKTKTKTAKGKVAKSKQGRTLSGSLRLKGKSKPAKKK